MLHIQLLLHYPGNIYGLVCLYMVVFCEVMLMLSLGSEVVEIASPL